MRAGKVRRVREQNNVGVLLAWCGVIALFILWASIANADVITDERAVKAIIGEAEDQGYNGMKAVACGIRNRGTLKEVYGEKAPRVLKHQYSEDIEAKAMVAWAISADPEECTFIKGATHWENIKAFGRPYWVPSMVKTFKYRDHVFYRRK